MNVLATNITNAVSLLKGAIQVGNAKKENKAAAQSVRMVLKNLFAMKVVSDSEMASLNTLLKFDEQLDPLESKYRIKIQRCFLSIRDIKANSIAQGHLNATCTKISFANEDPLAVAPLALTTDRLDLIKTHSPFIQEKLSRHVEGTVFALPSVNRKYFEGMLDFLAGGEFPIIGEKELFDFYEAAGGLGIDSVMVATRAVLQESLFKQSYDNLLHILCNIATGEMPGDALGEAAFAAFLEQECRYAYNTGFLQQPDPWAYIECIYCPQQDLTLAAFKEQATQRVPYLIDYLDALEGRAGEKDAWASWFGTAVRAMKNGAEVQFPDLSSLEARFSKALCYITKTVVSQSGSQQVADLRQNPKDWMAKLEELFKTNGEAVGTEVQAMLQALSEEHTEPLEKFCHVMLFRVLAQQKKLEEAKRELAFVKHSDLGRFPEVLTFYRQLLLEAGLFARDVEEFSQPPGGFRDVYERKFERLQDFSFGKIAFGKKTFTDGSITICGIKLSFKKETAIENLIEHCQADRRLAFPRILLAQYFYRKNQLNSAIKYCNEVLAIQDNPAMLLMRANMHRLNKNPDLARSDLAELLKKEIKYEYLIAYVDLLPANEAYAYLMQLQACKDVVLCAVFILQKMGQAQKAKEILDSCPDKEDEAYLVRFALTPEIDKAERLQAAKKALEINPLSMIALKTILSFYPNFALDISIQEQQFFSQVYQRLKDHSEWQEGNEALFPLSECTQLLLEDKLLPANARPYYKIFEAVYEDPIVAATRMAELQASLSPGLQKLSQILLAHRLEDKQQLFSLAQSNEKYPIVRTLVADACRRQGDLKKAREWINTIADKDYTYVQIVEAAIQFGETPACDVLISKLKAALNQGCVYKPFIQLAHVILYKILHKAGLPEAKVYESKLLGNACKSTEALVALEYRGCIGHREIREFIQRGYTSDEVQKVYHRCLNKISDGGGPFYGLMEEPFLSRQTDLNLRYMYGNYLFFFGRYQEALAYLGDRWKIAECYDHLQRYPEAIASYRAVGTIPALVRVAVLEARAQSKTFQKDVTVDYGLYPEARWLYQAQNYAEIKRILSHPLTAKFVKAQGLFMKFLLAESLLKQEDRKGARREIKKILELEEKQKDVYGDAFFTKVKAWRDQELNGNKRRKIDRSSR